MTPTAKATVTLPSDTQILITREFDAPRRLVYRAWTDPALIARWWSARRGEVTSIEVDLRVGGTYRYVMRATAGFEVAFHGEYHEIVTDERLVYTEVFEGAPGPGARATVTFADAGPRTLLTILVEHPDKAGRDMHVESGMEDGLQDALADMEQVARSLSVA